MTNIESARSGAKFISISPNYGSLNGETKLSITGTGFPSDQLNSQDDNPNVGTKVYFVSESGREYSCRLFPDGCVETIITCYTPKGMRQEDHSVKITIEGKLVDEDCPNAASCTFKPHIENTPIIETLVPQSGPPDGTLITVTGLLYTDKFGNNIEKASNGRPQRILRLYMGGQTCELKPAGSDQFHLLALDNEESDHGTFKCNTTGKSVGCFNLTMIIDPPYGRSMSEVQRLSENDEICMFVSYAVITRLSHSSGSTEGGQTLFIYGNYLDDTKPYAPASVLIEDTVCEVKEVVRDVYIKCVVARQPTGVGSSSRFVGNRGLRHEIWSISVSNLPGGSGDIRQLGSSSSGYQQKVLDETYAFDNTMDNYVSRMTFYYVPKNSGTYEFYLLGDDYAELFIDENSAVSSSSEWAVSNRRTLNKDQKYFMQVIHYDVTGESIIYLKVKYFDSNYTRNYTNAARQETQKIIVTSTEKSEEQELEFRDFVKNANVRGEILEVMINTTGKFRLGLKGVYTGPLNPDADEIKEALNSLPLPGVSVGVTRLQDPMPTFHIAFANSNRGDFRTVNVLKVAGGPPVLHTVKQNRSGIPDLDTVTLNFAGVDSDPFSITDLTAEKLETAINSLFVAKCSEKTFLPSRTNAKYTQDFETPSTGYIGTVVKDSEPFCGRYILENPYRIYKKEDNTDGISLEQYKQLCFAYKGFLQDYIQVSFTYKTSVTATTSSDTRKFPHTFRTDSETESKRWYYTCVDLYEKVTGVYPSFMQYRVTEIRVRSLNADKIGYIDAVYIGQKAVTDPEPNKLRRKAALPNGEVINTVSVEASGNKYKVTLKPFNCGTGLPLFRLGHALVVNNVVQPLYNGKGIVRVTRKIMASPPPTGTLNVQFNGQIKKGLNISLEPGDFRNQLESLNGIGSVSVTREGDCANFNLSVTFLTRPGNQEEIRILSRNLQGTNPSVTAYTEEDGGVFYDPIPGGLVRTVEAKPQVTVRINNELTACLGDCSYEWLSSSTPVVSSVSPSSGTSASNAQIVITGSGFSTDNSNNHVTIGGVPCTVTGSSSSSSITCIVGNGPSGSHRILVNVDGKGFSSGNVLFTYISGINDISPDSGSLGGGVTLTISGYGFKAGLSVTIGGKPCSINDTQPNQIKCIVPPMTSPGAYTVIVTQGTVTRTYDSFTYVTSETPLITSISPQSFGVFGAVITIEGQSFTSTSGKVSIGGKTGYIISWINSKIIANFTGVPAGTHELRVSTNTGYATNSSYIIPTVYVNLVVNNVYPLDGSIQGGTNLTIIGEGFGTNASLSSVSVGGVSCLVDTITDTQIKCQLAYAGRHHSVTNGGVSPDYGIYYAFDHQYLTIRVGDVVDWSWYTPAFINDVCHAIIQVNSSTDKIAKIGGFSTPCVKNGRFSQVFTKAGTYYIWSGYVDLHGLKNYYMTVTVEPAQSSLGEVAVRISGIEALYTVSAGNTQTTIAPLSGCSDIKPSGISSNTFNYAFWTCNTPKVTSMIPRNGTVKTPITISGRGFSSSNSQNEVKFGDLKCDVTFSNDSTIVCNLLKNGEPELGLLHRLSLRVHNRGDALIEIMSETNKSFGVMPNIENIAPTKGSRAGGARVTVIGFGFGKTPQVSVGGFTCNVLSSTYSEIVFETPPSSSNAEKDVIVNAFVDNSPITATCETQMSVCKYTYSSLFTPVVTSISPSSTSGNTKITIYGSNWETTSDIEVTIGGVAASNIVVNANSIEADIGNIPVGSNDVIVRAKGKGKASGSLTMTGDAQISGINPPSGSLFGGTNITIQGNGFAMNKTTVVIDGSECKIISVSLSEVVCTTTPHAIADVSVEVTSNGVSYDPQPFAYNTVSTPTVDSISPQSGVSGDVLTISGSNLYGSIVFVKVGGVECPVTSKSNIQIQCTLGPHAAELVSVIVQVEGKGLSDTNIEFEYTLAIENVSPNEGSTGGKQTVTVTGRGFNENVTVTICSLPCEYIETTSTKYKCLTPANTNTGCDVAVSLNNVVKTQSGSYSYNAALSSVISGVSPKRGGTGGGTRITITGSGFGTVLDSVSVMIAGSKCEPQSVDETKIVCTSGAHAGSIETKVQVQISEKGINIEETVNCSAWTYIDVWSSHNTWQGNPPPVAGDFVVIPADMTLLLDTDTPVLGFLLIQGGKLIFDEKDIELKSKSIMITDGGLLQIGTESEPFQHKGIITLIGHVKDKETPIYGTKVLANRNGTVELHGKPVPVTWTKLAETAFAGSDTIRLQNPVEWNIHDEIIIATTGGRHSQRENEKMKISQISADKRTLTLESNLEYTHLGTATQLGGTDVEFRAEVGLLTHNVLVRGEADSQWEEDIEACDAGFDTGEFATQTCFQGRFGDETGSSEFGGMMLFHAPQNTTNKVSAHLSYVEVTFAGQAFRLGRYPIHFHMNGNMTGSYVRGCSIHETFNRAINIHGTHNLLVEHNVAYNVMGGSFFFEDGIETENIVQYNLVVFTRESSSLLNDDITPASFWVTNPNNIIQHNAAAGGTHFGFWYRMHDHPDGPSYNESIFPIKTPLGIFYNNSAHSFGWFGLWIFPEYFPQLDPYAASSEVEPAVFRAFFAWNNEKGVEYVNGGALQFINLILVNNSKAGFEGKKTIGSPLYTANSAGLFDSVISAHASEVAGKNEDCTYGGVILAYGPGFRVLNVTFVNFAYSYCVAFRLTRIDGTCSDLCGGYTYHLENLAFVNSPKKGAFDWRHEGILIDKDGKATGQSADWVVVPTTGGLPNECIDATEYSHGKRSASMCPAIYKNFHRFAFNEPSPSSLEGQNVIISNDYGDTICHFADKRLTHQAGWVCTLQDGFTYTMKFEQSPQIYNISFNGVFENFQDEDYVIIIIEAAEKPDRFSIDGGNTIINASESINPATSKNGDYVYEDNKIKFIVSAKQRDSDTSTSVNRPWDFSAYKCFYPDCIPPPDKDFQEPADERQNPFYLWDNLTMWNATEDGFISNSAGLEGMYGIPKTYDSVKIITETWVVVNKTAPYQINLRILYLEGVLEFFDAPGANYVLEADIIFITCGGRLLIGWPDNPFDGLATIILNGNHSSPNFDIVGDGPVLGSKAIGVFGGLDLHGKKAAISWTELAETAPEGSNTVTVGAAVEWLAGDDIVIASTDFDPWHTESFKITSRELIGNDRVKLSLNGTLRFEHTAHHEILTNGKEIKVGGAVGLLSHNIKIMGQDYNDLYEESYGARVLVGLLTNEGQTCTGYARLSYVEFYHTGQEGYTDDFDPRYSLAFLAVGDVSDVKPSSVTGCSFHNGFNTAIGVYGAGSLNVTNNVIFGAVGNGLVTTSRDTRLINNLLVLVISTASYQNRFEAYDFESNSGIEAMTATELILKYNLVTASERIGYHVPPHNTDDYLGHYENNKAYSNVLGGVVVEFRDSLSVTGCAKISNFTVWRSHDFGIYYQNEPCYLAENNFLIENQHALFALVLQPPSLSHEYADKTVTVRKNTFVGITNSFNCNKVKTPTNDHNYILSSNARVKGPNSGITLPAFTSKNNGLPSHPWPGSMSYQTIGGMTILHNNTFAKYKNSTCPPSYAVSTNSDFDDLTHPTHSTEAVFLDVDESNRYFNHRPNVAKINGADCVDMECDGHKKVLVKDLDGTLIGAVGSIIPQSQWEWDGDPRRGLGDYRIPKTMLSDQNGDRLSVQDIAPRKGIIGHNDCTYHNGWQAYACKANGVNYEMLVIESMDEDTETRRLSPVAVLGDGYIDLLNGPQDHGWCFGYTCRKRLSTFFAIVATGKEFLIHLTSKAPKHLRFRLLNTDEDKGVKIRFWYAERNRKDVYADNTLVRSTNTGTDKNGKLAILRATGNEFYPQIANVTGTNLFDKDSGELTFIIKGQTPINVITIESVIVTFGLPDLTVDEFFGENIVENLATFLNIPYDKVKIMSVTSETSLTRRKRSTGSGISVVIEVGNDAQSELNGTADDTLSYDDLTQIAADLVNECQVGDISSAFNISGSCESVVLPSLDTEIDSIEYIPQTPDHLIVVEQPSATQEGILLTVQPKLRVADIGDNIVTVLGTAEYPWQLTATIRTGTGHSNAVLGGTVTVEAVDGWFNFTDLTISHMGTGYILEFNVSYPVQAESFLIASSEFDVPGRTVQLHIHDQSSGDIVSGSSFSITLDLQDANTEEIISDIAWRDHTWTASATILGSSVYSDLSGFTSFAFDTTTGKAMFPDLEFTGFGVYYIKFRAVSNPPDFDLTMNYKAVVKDITHLTMPMEKEYKVEVMFEADFADVLATEDDQNEFEQMIITYFANQFRDVHFKGGSVSEGSILVTFVVEGPTSSAEETVESLCGSIQNETSFTFNGQSLTLSPYMAVNNEQYYGVKCGEQQPRSEDDDGMAAHLIAIIVIMSLVVIAAICGIVVWKTKVNYKGRSPVLVKPLAYNQTFKKSGFVSGTFQENGKSLENILFREDTDQRFSTGKAPVLTTQDDRSKSSMSGFSLRLDSPEPMIMPRDEPVIFSRQEPTVFPRSEPMYKPAQVPVIKTSHESVQTINEPVSEYVTKLEPVSVSKLLKQYPKSSARQSQPVYNEQSTTVPNGHDRFPRKSSSSSFTENRSGLMENDRCPRSLSSSSFSATRSVSSERIRSTSNLSAFRDRMSGQGERSQMTRNWSSSSLNSVQNGSRPHSAVSDRESPMPPVNQSLQNSDYLEIPKKTFE